MKFSVAIATYERADLLRRTLLSLAEAEPAKHGWQIIVVENGGRWGAEAVCKESALDVDYHWIAEAGVGRARQHAVDQISDGLVLFLDDDVRVSPNLLLEYERIARSNGPGAFYGGPILVDYEEPPPDWLLRFLPPSVTGWDAEHKWPWFLGANFAAFAEDIRSVGGFSLIFGPGALSPGTAGNPTGDETDLQMRLAARGCRQIYVPAAQVWHYVGASSCTPEWALHRRFRSGIAKALRKHSWYDDKASLGGVPLRLFARFMLSGAKLAHASLSGDKQERFRRQFEFQGYRGRIRGARLRARLPASHPITQTLGVDPAA